MNKHDLKQHFSIRKLTIGVASVLIGLSSFGAGQKAQAAPGEQPVQGVARVNVVHHNWNWKVNLLDGNGHYTNRYLRANTSWKVLVEATINGEPMYRLGTDQQWIPAKYVSYTGTHATHASRPENLADNVVYAPVINGNPNWKIALRNGNGGITGAYIPTNSTWKVIAAKNIGGTTYYCLGTGEQWVPAQYLEGNVTLTVQNGNANNVNSNNQVTPPAELENGNVNNSNNNSQVTPPAELQTDNRLYPAKYPAASIPVAAYDNAHLNLAEKKNLISAVKAANPNADKLTVKTDNKGNIIVTLTYDDGSQNVLSDKKGLISQADGLAGNWLENNRFNYPDQPVNVNDAGYQNGFILTNADKTNIINAVKKANKFPKGTKLSIVQDNGGRFVGIRTVFPDQTIATYGGTHKLAVQMPSSGKITQEQKFELQTLYDMATNVKNSYRYAHASSTEQAVFNTVYNRAGAILDNDQINVSDFQNVYGTGLSDTNPNTLGGAMHNLQGTPTWTTSEARQYPAQYPHSLTAINNYEEGLMSDDQKAALVRAIKAANPKVDKVEISGFENGIKVIATLIYNDKSQNTLTEEAKLVKQADTLAQQWSDKVKMPKSPVPVRNQHANFDDGFVYLNSTDENKVVNAIKKANSFPEGTVVSAFHGTTKNFGIDSFIGVQIEFPDHTFLNIPANLAKLSELISVN